MPGVIVVVGEVVAGAPAVTEMIVGLTTFCLWLLILRPLTPTQILETVRNALLIVILTILVAFIAGVSRPYTRWYRFDANAVESRGGLTPFRWYLPLSSSWEPPAVLAVLLGLVSLTLLITQGHRQKALSFAGFLVSAVTIFGVNGRTAELVFISGTLAITAAIYLRWIRVAALLVATAFMFLPLIYSAVAFIAQQFSSLIVSSGLAASSAKFSTLEGRTIIWDTTLRVFSDASPIRKIFGYGANGYITSGASGIYSQQFYGSAGSGGYRVSFYDTHNLLLGVMLSHGLFGILVLVVCWAAVLQRAVARIEGIGWAAPFIGAWVFGTMSSTSTSCTPSNATYGIVTLVLLVIPFLQKGLNSNAAIQSPTGAHERGQ
ncbi:MAG: O-antigen ligase family protein [Actinomycetales bacterium]|nr:O-antigen ligase family protein [Actinomycetales bacterium]